MARSIETCQGTTIKVGDKVRTSHGTVIRVEGASIFRNYYNAEACTLVDKDTPTTAEENERKHEEANIEALRRGEQPVKKVGGAQSDGDCIVWGG